MTDLIEFRRVNKAEKMYTFCSDPRKNERNLILSWT